MVLRPAVLTAVVVVVAEMAAVPPVDVGEVVTGAGFTLKLVPVTMVTCEPGFIWVGNVNTK